MLVSKAARRYATALLELAKEQNSVEEVLEDVKFVQNTITDSRDLLLFVKSPIVKPDKKAEALKEIFSEQVGKMMNLFITLIAKKKRADILGEIVEAFVDVYNKHAGIINVEVRVAQPLDDNHTAKLKSMLEETTGKKVQLHIKEVPELKGGLAVKIDDTVIDGSVKHKLEQLEELFLETAVE
ncbi:MAG: F0F1 ATP synthase subunit delta [Balneolaceae bacterium]|nr:F0F1 ATP synthase subunit delta [Balneolaceae bacterium]